MSALDRPPEADEVAEYYQRYLEYVQTDDLLGQLGSQVDGTLTLVADLGRPPDYRYARGKWSVKEVLVHLADTERIFAYRALRIARGDTTPLPGMEQDDYVVSDDLAHRTLEAVAAELRAVRTATLHLFRGLTDPQLLRTGTASGVSFTPRGIAWVIAGHELHHRAILDARYR